MNITDLIGVIPPLQYGIGLFVPLGVMYTLAILVENRWPRITKQYYSVKYGYPLLAFVIGIGLAIVDHLPDVQDVWYRDSWWAPLYHLGWMVIGLLMALKLKWAEIKESRTKRKIWHAVHPDKDVPTEWLNSEHFDYTPSVSAARLGCTKHELREWLSANGKLDENTKKLVASLKFGVAYSKLQHRSPTAFGHLLVATAMTYMTALVLSAVITKIVVYGRDIQQPWWYIGGMAAMLIALFLWYRTTKWDNARVRPNLANVHPDDYSFSGLVRWVKARLPQHDDAFSDFGDGPQGPQSELAAELLGPIHPEPDDDEAYRPSFGRQTEEPPPAPERFDYSNVFCLAPEVPPASPTVEEPAPQPPVAPEPVTVAPDCVQILSAAETQVVRTGAIEAADPLKQPGTPDKDGARSSKIDSGDKPRLRPRRRTRTSVPDEGPVTDLRSDTANQPVGSRPVRRDAKGDRVPSTPPTSKAATNISDPNGTPGTRPTRRTSPSVSDEGTATGARYNTSNQPVGSRPVRKTSPDADKRQVPGSRPKRRDTQQ